MNAREVIRVFIPTRNTLRTLIELTIYLWRTRNEH